MPTLKEFYPLIGQLVVEFQNLDLTLNLLFASLLREDPNVSMAFAVTLSFSKKIDVLKSIAPFKIPKGILETELEDVITKLSAAEGKRNQVIHASWIATVPEGKVFFHKPRATRKHGIKDGGIREALPSEIEDALRSIADAKQSVFRFLAKLERNGIVQGRTFSESQKKEHRNNRCHWICL